MNGEHGAFLQGTIRAMKRLLPLLGLLAACASAPDPMRVDTVTAPPTLHIGLGRCLRDERVRLRTGPDAAWMELHAGHPALAKAPATFRGDLEVEYTRDHRNHPVKPTVVRYHGVIHVHVTPDRKLILVNEVEIEAYLKGVVGKEMSLSEGAAALQAQVIAARTYALQEQRLGRLRAKGEPFDLYDDERSTEAWSGRRTSRAGSSTKRAGASSSTAAGSCGRSTRARAADTPSRAGSCCPTNRRRRRRSPGGGATTACGVRPTGGRSRR
jgi:hypothetical protein